MAVRRQGRFGFTPVVVTIPVAIATGTSAEELFTDIPAGFTGTLTAARMVASVIAATGASASRPVSLVRTRGGVDVTMASGTAVLADLDTKGEVKTLTLSTTAANLDVVDDDTLSFALAGSGTAFTAFTGAVQAVFNVKPQQA